MAQIDYLITGGTGLIGSALIKALPENSSITVLSRQSESKALRYIGREVTVVNSLNAIASGSEINTVVNLAGEPIADKPWTDSRKQQLRDSRIGITEQIAALSERLSRPIETLISGSAIGIYPVDSNMDLSESSEFGNDFSALLCRDWEIAAYKVRAHRVCIVRTSIVLSAHGGMLSKLKPSFYLGGGAVLGTGKQVMSWIHIDDMVGALISLISNSNVEGAFNLTSPAPIDNLTFSDTLARLMRRPRFMRLPQFAVQLLFGQRATLLLGSQRVLPDRLLELGYSFKYSDITAALNSALKGA